MTNQLSTTWQRVPKLTALRGIHELGCSALGTYVGFIQAGLLLSHELRQQDLILTMILHAAHGVGEQINSFWHQALADDVAHHYQDWLQRQARTQNSDHAAHHASTYNQLCTLVHTQSAQLISIAGVIGTLISSFYVAHSHSSAHILSPEVLTYMTVLGTARLINFRWTQHTQAQRTNAHLAAQRANYKFVQAASQGTENQANQTAQVFRETRHTERQQERNLVLRRRLESSIAVASYYGLTCAMGWFDPTLASPQALANIQAAMVTATSLVESILRVPNLLLLNMEQRTQIRAYLSAEVPNIADA